MISFARKRWQGRRGKTDRKIRRLCRAEGPSGAAFLIFEMLKGNTELETDLATASDGMNQ
jgi:hypothetical protein